jgi:outer membrane protein TolC
MRSFQRAAWFAAAPLLIGGCAVGPHYIAPAPPVATEFVGTAAVEGRAHGAAPADLVSWWKSFDDPLLSSLVERALAQNLDLQQAVARVAQARAALTGASAALLPSGQVSGAAGTNYQSLETPIGRIGSAFPQFERRSDLYQLDLGASWEVDLFGGKSAARDAARADRPPALSRRG